MSTTSPPSDPARARRPAAAAPVSALALVGVVVLAFNMRTAIGEIPPVLPDLGLSSAGQSILATVPVVCFGLAALAAPALRTKLGEERGAARKIAAQFDRAVEASLQATGVAA